MDPEQAAELAQRKAELDKNRFEKVATSATAFFNLKWDSAAVGVKMQLFKTLKAAYDKIDRSPVCIKCFKELQIQQSNK